MAKLSINESANSFWTDVGTVDFNDLITLGTGNKLTIANMPVNSALEAACVWKITAAAGTTTVVFDIGTTAGDPDEFIDALDADGMTVPLFNTGDQFTSGYSKFVSATVTAAPVYLKLTDAAIASATAGKWGWALRIIDLGQYNG